jgi:hypothetical protein
MSGKNLEDATADAAGAPAKEEPMHTDNEKLFLEDMEADNIQVLPDVDGLTVAGIEKKTKTGKKESSLKHLILTVATFAVAISSRAPATWCCCASTTTAKGGSVHVGEGRYMTVPWEIGEDQLTRAFIPVGYSFEYFEHGNLGGHSNTVGGGDRCIDLYMRGHEDWVSSFVIHRL